jgi:hypothetical protein
MKRHLTEQELIEQKFKLALDEQAGVSTEHLAGCAECRERLEQLNQKFAALDLLAEDTHASEELISQTLEQSKQPARKKVVPFGRRHWIGAVAAVLVVGFVLLIGTLTTEEGSTQREFAEESKPDDSTLHRRLKLLPEPEEGSEVMMVAKGLADERDATMAETLATNQVATEPASMPSAMDVSGAVQDLEGAAASRPDPRTKPDQYAFAPYRERAPTTESRGEATTPAQVPVQDQEVQSLTVGLEDARKYSTELAGTAGEIPEEPPFAPASAIELVTLPRRDNVQLTIYNSADLTLVRERRNLTLKKGWNWLQFMWANTLIDPTSLSLEPSEQAGKIDIEQLVFPARLRELGRWLIRSEISGQVPFEITYFTSGLSWRAFYMGTLSKDEKTMRLQGYVRIGNNSGEDYENAQTRLLVGKVNVLDKIADLAKRRYAYGRPEADVKYDSYSYQWGMKVTNGVQVTDLSTIVVEKFGDLRPKEIKKEGLSEYFLYTIEGTETIADKWGKRLASFDVEDIEVESLYKYDEERWGKQAIRFVSFANDQEHNLGETPIPNGAVKIYSNADEEGYLSYVGGANVKYIPVDEDVELNLGPARLVEVEPKLMDFRTDNYVFDNKKNIAGWDEIRTRKIEITNTRTLPIEIEITRGFGTAYWTLQAEIPYEKHDSTHARFTLEAEPRSKQTFDYTVTTYHGRREEQVNR